MIVAPEKKSKVQRVYGKNNATKMKKWTSKNGKTPPFNPHLFP
jgi:hypothetical protein